MNPDVAQLLPPFPSSIVNTTFIESPPAADAKRRALPGVRTTSQGIEKCPSLRFSAFKFSKLTRIASQARAMRSS